MLRCLISVVVGSLVLGATVLGTPAPTAAQRSTPVPAPGLDQVVAIATGSCRSFALRSDGTVLGWGCGSDWDFGVPALKGLPMDTPVEAVGLDEVRAIATGDGQTLALRSDGTVWAWGQNDRRQVGVITDPCPIHNRPCSRMLVPVPGVHEFKAVAAAQDSSFVLRTDGTVWGWGNGSTTPAPVSGLDGVVAIAAEAVRQLAQKHDGTVWSWGEPDQPAPTVVAGLGPMKAIVGGGLLSAAVAPDGTVWTWGLDPIGFQPAPSTRVDDLDQVIAVAMGTDSNLALKADGTVWTWDEYGRPSQVPAPKS